MIDMTENERSAIIHGGNCGGEYLDSIRITDLARLTQANYETFIRCVVSGYLGEMDRLRAAAAKDFPIPY